MKKRYFCILMAVLSVILLAACGNSGDSSQENSGSVRSQADKVTQNSEESGGTQMQGIMINVGGQSFQAILYDNETAKTLKERLPLTLLMEELNGNEKFYYLEDGLPTDSEHVGNIQTGDIMLFGSDCLVLFFDDFNTSYSYTRIGHIEDSQGFADALADGTVEVTFRAGK